MNRKAPASIDGESDIGAGLNYSLESSSGNKISNYYPFILIRPGKVESGIELSGDPDYPDATVINKLALYFTEKLFTEESDPV